MSDFSDYGETPGDEEAIRYPRRHGYPQRPGWQDYHFHEDIPLEDMDLRTPGQYPDDFEVPGPSPYQQDESDEDESEAGESEAGEYEVGVYEQGVSEQREDEPYSTRHGTPEPFLPPSQPGTPQIIMSEPDIPSTRSVVSGDYPPHASAFGMGEMLYPSMDDPHAYLQEDPSQGLSYGTPTLAIRPADSGSSAGSAEGSSPQYQPSVSPHPLSSAQGSMADQGSPSLPGTVSVEASPSVQELSPATYLYQRGEYSGTVQQQKRGRESSSSSSAGNLRPQRKHHHGGQGPDVPQSIPEAQQGHTSLLGISAFAPGGNVQPPPLPPPPPPSQGRGSSYGDPDPHGRADASEIQQISEAYASQDVYQPRPNPFAGMQRGVPSSYTAGAGRGYARQPQGESSAQGAARSRPLYHARPVTPYEPLPRASVAGRGAGQPQYQPMHSDGPSAASSNTGGTSGGYAPRPQPQPSWHQSGSGGPEAGQLLQYQSVEPGGMSSITTVGPSVGFPEVIDPTAQNPMHGMSAGDVWTFISGQEGGREGENWDGPRFKVDENKTTLWTPEQLLELKVITASFESWDEVLSLGQGIPGRHGPSGVTKRAGNQKPRTWPADQDAKIRSLQSPRLEDRQAALQNLMEECGRYRDEIIGRCMLFARSNQRVNLGVVPHNGHRSLLATIRRK